MKLIIVFLTTGLLQVHATGYSQEITFSGKKVSLEKVFVAIESQTNYNVVYEGSLLINAKPVSITVKKKRIQDFLNEVLSSQGLDFEIQNTTIIISKRITPALSEALGENFSSRPPPITVKGKVLNEKGEPVAASIIVKGTKNGTTTDGYGNFILNNVSDKATLIISGINIESSEIKIEGRNEITVAAVTKITSEEEVTVKTNYYSTTKKLSTGNISKVTAKDIERQPVISPLLALQGRVPGLEITPSSGAPGVAPRVRIRGTNSLRQFKRGNATAGLETDGNYPLYVIDGVPISSIPFNTLSTSFTEGGYDPLSTLNPANIESIEIIKDGDATAIYGSRGANGVILITTKRSSKHSERANVDTRMYIGAGRISKHMDLLDLNEYLSMRKEALSNSNVTWQQAGAVDLYLWDTTRSTNWQKLFLNGNAKITNVQSTISGGTKNTSFRFNAGYHKETLLFRDDFGYHRLSGQLTVNHVSTSQKLRMSFSTNHGVDKSHFFSGDLMSAALTLAPNAPELYNEDGSLNWEVQDLPTGEKGVNTWINPLSYFRSTQDAVKQNNISDINLAYELLPGLSVSSTAGYTSASKRETRKIPQSALSPTNNVKGGAYFTDSRTSAWIIEPKISYAKKLNLHTFDLLVGGTWHHSTNAWHIIRGDEYVSDALLGSLEGAGRIDVIKDEFTEYKYNSLYGRFGYNLKEKYVLNLSARRDGSSRFGSGNRFANFGSFGAAWIFTEEKFIQDAVPFLNFGKFRTSYGITGSDNIGDYNYYNLYQIAETRYGGLTGISPFSLFNPDYAWEVTKKFEAALELSIAQNKISAEVSWYRNRSSNQLINYPLSLVTGFSAVQSNFEATVQNSGWEASVRLNLLNTQIWQWNTAMNISFPLNKLIKFQNIEESPYATAYKVGEPLSVSWVYTWLGVNSETGTHDFVDLNKDGRLDNLDRTVQNLAGTVYYGGISNNLQYKNFEISFLFQFSHRQSARYLPGLPGTQLNQSDDVLNRWRRPGDHVSSQRFSYAFRLSNGVLITAEEHTRYALLASSTYNSVHAGFIRLKTLSAGYKVPNKWGKHGRLQDAKIFLDIQNLVTFTRYEGLDPETGSGLPPLRVLTAGLQIKF